MYHGKMSDFISIAWVQVSHEIEKFMILKVIKVLCFLIKKMMPDFIMT